MKKFSHPYQILLLVLILTITLPLIPLRTAASYDLPPEGDSPDEPWVLGRIGPDDRRLSRPNGLAQQIFSSTIGDDMKTSQSV